MRTWHDIGIVLPYGATGEVRTTCPRCASPSPHPLGPGSGPHYQRLVCGQCGAFLRWLPQPQAVQR